jgi:hypothetical protein
MPRTSSQDKKRKAESDETESQDKKRQKKTIVTNSFATLDTSLIKHVLEYLTREEAISYVYY